MNTGENILVIRLKSIGDVLFTLPAVHALREYFPDANITFLTSKENVPLLRGFREVDGVITLDRAALRNSFRAAPEIFRLLLRLRAGKFSLIVDFQGYGETAWLSWWSGALRRWGSLEGGRRRWAYTLGANRDYRIHPVEQNLSLLRQCGLPAERIRNDFVLPDDALGEARRFFTAQGLDVAKPTLYLQPFTSTLDKNWPYENYLTLANHWRARGVQIIIGGGPADKPLLDRARSLGFTVPAGLPRLTDAGLMKLSSLIVGGDTGFLHLAVALGKRVLMLIKRNGPGAAIPYRHPEWIVKPQAGLPLAQIDLEPVLRATQTAFDELGMTNHSTGNISAT